MTSCTQADDAAPVAFSEVVRVRYRDTDMQGHLYFGNYMVYADEAATRYMGELGFDWSDLARTPCMLFMARIDCDFAGECRYGDEVRVAVGYSRLGNSSARLEFHLSDVASGGVLARGAITQVFVDHDSRRPTPIPETYRAAVIKRQPELAPA